MLKANQNKHIGAADFVQIHQFVAGVLGGYNDGWVCTYAECLQSWSSSSAIVVDGDYFDIRNMVNHSFQEHLYGLSRFNNPSFKIRNNLQK